MQINPLLLSIAAPVAAKTVRAVVHTAQHVGQNFLQTLSALGTDSAESLSPASEPTNGGLADELQSFANRFREWLADKGVQRPFELKFAVDANGDNILNVVGADSQQIVDSIDASSDWQEQLAALTRKAQDLYGDASLPAGVPFSPEARVQVAISAEDAWIVASQPARFA